MDYRLCTATPSSGRGALAQRAAVPSAAQPVVLSPARKPAVSSGVRHCWEEAEVHFGSMNNLAKVSPQTIGTWSQILLRVPGSRLVMTGVPEGRARRVLGERFASHGVDMERLLLHGRLSDEAYGDLLDTIDIALTLSPTTERRPRARRCGVGYRW